MKKKTIKITTFIILSSLLSNLILLAIYYFTEALLPTLLFCVILSLFTSHILLEKSFSYHACFLYTTCNVLLSSAIIGFIYLFPTLTFIQFNSELLLLIFINWLIPIIYSVLRNLTDHGPRFIDFPGYFKNVSILFAIYYLSFLIIITFIYPADLATIVQSKANNYIPFYTIATFIENHIYNNNELLPFILYLLKYIVAFIPLGFFLHMLIRKLSIFLKFVLLIFAVILPEILQFITHLGYADIDDFLLALLGSFIGYTIYRILNFIFIKVNGHDFLYDRSPYSFYRKFY